NHICYSGFIGLCNLIQPSTTEKAFRKFKSSICQESPFDRIDVLTFPTKESIEVCGGKRHRYLLLDNTRFQVLSTKCDPVGKNWLGCSA
ncbi:hypothetical protein PHYSODRAFT_524352, partial [Phytophthora sojae]